MELIKTRVNRRLVLSEYSGGIRFGTDALLLAHFALSAPGRGMDLGAGSGIIGFLLLTSGRASHIDGIELQPDYVDLCRKNASENGLEARYTAVCRDIRDLHSFPEEEYDFCVSNPPYLPLGCGKENASEPLNIARREVKCDILSVCAAASLPSPIISDGRRKKPCGTAAGATGKPSMIFIFVFRKKIFPRPQRKCAGSIPLVNPLVKKGQKTLQNVHPPYHPAQNNSTSKRRKPLEIAHFLSISRGFPLERIMGVEPIS